MESADFTATGATLLQDGITAAKAGNKDLARSFLLRAVAAGNGDEIGLLWLAYLAEDVQEAIGYLRRVLDINPHNSQAQTGLNKALLRQGITLAKAGKKAAARELLLEVSTLDSGNELVWLWLASVAEYQQETVACLRKALAINPNSQLTVSWL